MKNTGLWINTIIPFSNVDGPGNRISIFVQGCNIHCVYCHNSETINHCCHCGKCLEVCEAKALYIEEDKVKWREERCQKCDHCIMTCPYQSTPKAKFYTYDMLFEIIDHYAPYVRGLTLSGGEATLYGDTLIPIIDYAHNKGLSVMIDTNGFFDLEDCKELIDKVDKFLFDIKNIENIEMTCGIKDDRFINNLIQLLEMDKIEEVRTVILKKYMSMEATVRWVSQKIRDYKEVGYRIIPVHLNGLKKEQIALIKEQLVTQQEIDELIAIAKDMGVQKIIYQEQR